MAFVSLYRKYRSQTFADLVGQEHVVRTLQSAISSGRFSHAYLFTGPRGTGKTSTARLLAKSLCCEHGPSPEPCNQCWICESISANNCLDVIEIDAASESGVDEVREKIVEKADYQPAQTRFKIYIIDEVHDLSAKAFDALLKTIEEPPAHLVFILATTEFNKVPRTIQSRCQKFDFHRGSLRDLSERLEYVAKEEKIEVEPAALSAIARMADGGYRDALTLLEQAALTSEGPISVSHVYSQFGWVDDALSDAILLAIADKDVSALLKTLGQVFDSGRDPRSVVESLIYRLSELTGALFGVADEPDGDAALQAALHETAVRLGQDRILELRGSLAQAHRTIRDISLPRLWLESELLRLASKPLAKAQPRPQEAATATKPQPVQPKPSEPKPAPPKAAARAPAPQAQPQAKPSEEVPHHTLPPLSGDEALDRAQEAWHAAALELGALSKLMAMRLATTTVSKVEDHTIHVQFERELERDWVLEGAKRQQAILDAVRKHGQPDWNVAYSVAPKSNGEATVPAVELPAEGERLVEMAKEILGGM